MSERTSQPINRRIFQAALGIAVATFAVRLIGLLKNQAVAARFGVGDAVEAYFLAAVLPTFVFGALGSTLPAALVPVVSGVRARAGELEGRALERQIYAWSLAGLALVTALLALAWPLFLASAGGRFQPEKAELAMQLFHGLLPIVFLHGMAMVWAAVLKGQKRFLATAWAMGAVPLTITLVVLLGGQRFGVRSIVAGHVLGTFVELVLVGWTMRRAGGALLPDGLPRATAVTRALGRQYLPAVGGGLLLSSTTLVDQAMAARLVEGSLATLTYATAVITALLSIGTTALGTAILPYLSDMAARGQLGRMRESLLTYTRLVFLVATPAALVFAWSARPIVALLFERGAFEAQATEAVGSAFGWYVLQLPFYTTVVLCSRALSALRKNQLVLLAALLNLALNIGLNLLFIQWMGVNGIALATSVAHLIVALFLWGVVVRRLAGPDGPDPAREPA